MKYIGHEQNAEKIKAKLSSILKFTHIYQKFKTHSNTHCMLVLLSSLGFQIMESSLLSYFTTTVSLTSRFYNTSPRSLLFRSLHILLTQGP